jgi:hypothetical protein
MIRAEWRRLFTRRITRIMMLLILAVLTLAALAIGSRSHPHTPQTLAHARAFAADQRAQNLAQCLVEAHAGVTEPGQSHPLTAAACRQMARRFTPSLSQFQGYQFTFRTEIGTFVFLFGGLLALFGFIVGASFIGAEWSSGGMATLLTWRRSGSGCCSASSARCCSACSRSRRSRAWPGSPRYGPLLGYAAAPVMSPRAC